MNAPSELKYTKTHEWVKVLPNGNWQVGLSDYAQSELGDLVFVGLPEVGDALTLGESFADVESVKAVSDVYSPATGVVAAANAELLDAPDAINSDCYSAWLVEIEQVGDTEELLDAAAYQALVAEEG